MRLIESHELFRSTEIGELPESWDVLPLGDLFDVQQGKALSPAARMGVSPRPFLRTANILWGRLDLETLDRMNFSSEEAERLSLRSGDLLVCEGGEIGRTALWRGEVEGCSYQNHVHRLRAKRPDVVPEFVMYWMQAAFVRLGLYGGVGNRTTIPNLSGARLKQLPLPLPSVSEQRAIIQILSRLQASIEMREKVVATLKELKAATMAKLFREGLRGEPLKQTEIGDVPKSWAIVRLGDYCTISSGGTPSRDNAEYWNGDIPWVKTGEIDYRPITRTEEHITQLGLKNSSARLFPKGTLLMAMYGQGVTRGKIAFLEIEAATNQACAALFPQEGLDAGYLYSFCVFAYDRIRELGHGANQKNLSADLIREIRMALPPLAEEQREIYGTLKTIESRIRVSEEQRDGTQAAFASMLCLLMIGRVRASGEAMVSGEVVEERGDSSLPSAGGGAPGKLPEAVEQLVTELARRFELDRVTLFGPPLPGSPRAFGAVGLLVEMPFRGLARDEAARIAHEIPHDFSLDLLVRRPEDLQRAREIGDRYLGGILEHGRVVYTRPPGALARQPAEREAEPKAPRRPPQMLSEEALQAIVRRIVETVQPEQIVLFGSAARGEMGPDSDVDLLVVKACADRRAVAQGIRKHLADVARGLPKDIIVVTPEDVERDRDTIGYIIRPALREGRVVYAA